MSNNSGNISSLMIAVRFFSILTILFIVLKVIGEIDWPWIWVLAPAWIPMLLWFIFVVIIFRFITKK